LHQKADFAPVATSVQLWNRADSVQKPCRAFLETPKQFTHKWLDGIVLGKYNRKDSQLV